MDRSSIAQVIKEVILKQVPEAGPEPLEDGERLNAGRLNITSLSFIGIVLSLETDLGIRFDDSAFMDVDLETVGDLIDYVHTRYFGGNASSSTPS